MAATNKVYILNAGLKEPVYYTSCSCAGDGCSCGLMYNIEEQDYANSNTKRQRTTK